MNAMLSMSGVSKRFGGVIALADVNLHVQEGEIHALIGPNGAGKSTLLNLLSGIYRPTTGEIRFQGMPLSGLRADELVGRGVARTFQNLALGRGRSVRENLLDGRHHLFSAGLFGLAFQSARARRDETVHRSRVHEVAEFLGLAEVLDRPAGTLPYGVQKRVELARALCAEPRVVILDEPVAGMSAEEMAVMAHAIREAHAALDLTILLVEHNMSFVMGLADVVSVLDFGRIIATGTPAEVTHDPQVIRSYLGLDTGSADSSAKEGE